MAPTVHQTFSNDIKLLFSLVCFFLMYVYCVCIVYACLCMCTCMCTLGARGWHQGPSCHPPPSFSRWSFTDLTILTGQQAPGTLVFQPPQCDECRWAPLGLAFYVGAGIKRSSSCLYGQCSSDFTISQPVCFGSGKCSGFRDFSIFEGIKVIP